MAQPGLDAFQVIAGPSRQMLHLLSKDSLAENFDMGRPAVSKHVKILHSAGFIDIQDIGRERRCTLKKDGFGRLQEWVNYFDNFWGAKLKKLEYILNAKSKL